MIENEYNNIQVFYGIFLFFNEIFFLQKFKKKIYLLFK